MSKSRCSICILFFSLRSELEFETSNDVDFFSLRSELIKDLNSNMNWESDFDWSKRIWLHCRSMISSKTEFKRVLRNSWCIRCSLNVSREDDCACIDCEVVDENIIAIDISMNCWLFDFLSDVKSSNVSSSVIVLNFLNDVKSSCVRSSVIVFNFLNDVESSNVNFFVISLSSLTSLVLTISMSRSRLKLSREVELKLILVWDCTHCRKEMINLNWNIIKTRIMTIWIECSFCLISTNILIKMKVTIFLFFIFTFFMLRLYIFFTLSINFWLLWRSLNHDLSSIFDVM